MNSWGKKSNPFFDTNPDLMGNFPETVYLLEMVPQQLENKFIGYLI
jgi:hypothetical protein